MTDHSDAEPDPFPYDDVAFWYSPQSLIALVETIEKEGVWSTDRFGRMFHCDPQSSEAKLALDALAEQKQREQNGYVHGEDEPMDYLGLYLPKSITQAQGKLGPKDIPAHANSRRSNNERVIIGALLDYLCGRTTGTAHPEWGISFTPRKHGPLRSALSETFSINGRTIEPFSDKNLSNVFNEAIDAFELCVQQRTADVKKKKSGR